MTLWHTDFRNRHEIFFVMTQWYTDFRKRPEIFLVWHNVTVILETGHGKNDMTHWDKQKDILDFFKFPAHDTMTHRF